MFNNVCVFLSVCLLFILANCIDCYEATIQPDTSNRRALVLPEIHHARTKRQLSTTRQEGSSHHDELTVTVTVKGESYTLDLKLNHGLLPVDHTFSYQEGGETVLHKPKIEELDFCQYTGHVRGKPNSWVALSTCHGLRGTINDGTKIRYIEPAEERELQSPHYVYEQSDVKTEGICGNDDLSPQKSTYYNLSQDNPSQKDRQKREASFKIRGPFNATERSRYVELVLVADYALYLGVRRDLRALHYQLQEITNILHAIYAPLNIFIALTGVQVWTTGNKIILSHNNSITLDNFLLYRQEVLLKAIPRQDHAQLITATQFDRGVVGFAYTSKMGSDYHSGGVIHRDANAFTAADSAFTAAIMAHEMGHNFGMLHDTADSGCRDEHCIMYPSATNPIPVHFSDTSLKELMLEFSKGIDYALRNKPTSLFKISCGNGFVEPGEECDCGVTLEGIGTNGCHRCCNPKTCRLRSNATCATGVCCNFKTCQMKPAATLCRATAGDCDLPEYCSGDSEYCPEDVFKMDTTPCSDKAYCVQGRCRSRDTQCRLLWGDAAKNAREDCYEKNVLGDEVSNCGHDSHTKRYRRCEKKDSLCGRLYCVHFRPRVEFGNLVYRLRSFYATNYTGGTYNCDGVRIDGLKAGDPGMVPDGAECGAGQMCLQQRCLAVDDARAHTIQHISEGCRANCSGHGICNSKGQCHCNDGFSPPLCDRGAGDPRVQETFKLVMCIIFLGLVPVVALIVLLIYFMKRKSLLWFEQNSKLHRSLSSTASVNKKIRSLFSKKERKNKSASIYTDFDRNARPETVKSIAKHEIKIIRDVQAEAALQSKFDINSYINYRNGTQKTVMKMTKEDIEVIMSGTVEVLPKPVSNGESTSLNNKNSDVHKVNMVDIKVGHNPQIKHVSSIKSTHHNHVLATKHKAGNADNNVFNKSVAKRKVVLTDNFKDLKLKPIINVKPITRLNPTNHD